MLEHLSFSIVTGGSNSRILDITCKDEFEFDHWVTGLKAIRANFANCWISKKELLSHSRRFQNAMGNKQFGIKLTSLPEIKEEGQIGLDDCIETVSHTPDQLNEKFCRLMQRHLIVRQQVKKLQKDGIAANSGNDLDDFDVSLALAGEPAYEAIFESDQRAGDEEMELKRIFDLCDEVEDILENARMELTQLVDVVAGNPNASSKNSKRPARNTLSNNPHKTVDQLLWKAEVDLENIEDMYLRFTDNPRENALPFAVALAEVSDNVTSALEAVQSEIDDGVEKFRTMFSHIRF